MWFALCVRRRMILDQVSTKSSENVQPRPFHCLPVWNGASPRPLVHAGTEGAGHMRSRLSISPALHVAPWLPSSTVRASTLYRDGAEDAILRRLSYREDFKSATGVQIVEQPLFRNILRTVGRNSPISAPDGANRLRGNG